MSLQYAAVDLGSNSFHLLVVRLAAGEMQVVDKLRERVRLAEGLGEDKHLDGDVRERALACLSNFKQRLADVPAAHIRVCGTNTFRKMADSDAFLAEAEAALGHRIEIVSGQEEARLVYRGVCQNLQYCDEKRLVIDIGGGSTECIVGHGDLITRADSLYMGCVGYTVRFFKKRKITQKTIDKAVIAARLEVGSLHRSFKSIGWDVCYGSSGTVNAIQDVLAASGRSRDEITLADLKWLLDEVVDAGDVKHLRLQGLKPERAVVFAAGLCILYGLFRSLAIDRMYASPTAMREGIIADVMGRSRDTDIRDETVRRMGTRYSWDEAHSKRVAHVVDELARQALPAWGIDTVENRNLLNWTAQLHEVGKAINYTGYHRHGSYLVANSNMAGFSRRQQALLAALILGQRRKLIPERISGLVGRDLTNVLRLIVLFRLASRVCRTRSPNPRPSIMITVSGQKLSLGFPKGWIASKPLTLGDLKQEQRWLSSAGFELTWND
ncbi:MAG: Ppx/GppA phosphatase family protein [Myxococcota bacterium]|nr:Ppx/GppA phosphatase family protein [Myxococcota bacterium]